ncbi:hypothetical protein BgAZ_205880 [Babesia gibsoni]|uniref:Uncharacterized protein n=1 Tax=Babesia gibsoni TaxID=33632 RepID=A0AAD8LS65_BABGI|nr:hypothetical protein BgAZ_205880 [Babesia gibsoni]
MDVEEYLRLVREEEASLPDVSLSAFPDIELSLDGKSAKKFERLIKLDDESLCLDSGFRFGSTEMNFFKAMKAEINSSLSQAGSQEKCGLSKYCIAVLRRADPSISHSTLDDLDEKGFSTLFTSNPPKVTLLCQSGISFATVHTILHGFACYVCDGRGKNINEVSCKWLFTILLVLDELHAIVESICYELQRIKRAIARKLKALRESILDEHTENIASTEYHRKQREIASLTLNVSIIQEYFNQR